MAIQLTDTHCHIQFTEYPIAVEQVFAGAKEAGVSRMIAVGCELDDSKLAVDFAAKYDNVWASIGLHPHEGAKYAHNNKALAEFADLVGKHKVVAIGETGLDYYYENSLKADQKKLLEFQLELAAKYDLPVIFHVREAFEDFWPIFDRFQGLRGVIHSFTSDTRDLERILYRGLYVGLNGIMTFTKRQEQLEMAKNVPLERLLLETDAPFLTPVPFRGTICEPKHVRNVAEFLADLRGESLEQLAEAATANSQKLFGL